MLEVAGQFKLDWTPAHLAGTLDITLAETVSDTPHLLIHVILNQASLLLQVACFIRRLLHSVKDKVLSRSSMFLEIRCANTALSLLGLKPRTVFGLDYFVHPTGVYSHC